MHWTVTKFGSDHSPTSRLFGIHHNEHSSTRYPKVSSVVCADETDLSSRILKYHSQMHHLPKLPTDGTSFEFASQLHRNQMTNQLMLQSIFLSLDCLWPKRWYWWDSDSSYSHPHTLHIICTCCYDELKGTQDQDPFACSFSDFHTAVSDAAVSHTAILSLSAIIILPE